MTPKERVLAALTHREVDRTPIFEKLVKDPAASDFLGRPSVLHEPNHWDSLAERGWKATLDAEAQDLADLVLNLEWDMVRLYFNAPKDSALPKRIGSRRWERWGHTYEWDEVSWTMRCLNPPPAETDDQMEERFRAKYAAPWTPPSPDNFAPINAEDTHLWRRVLEIVRNSGRDVAVFYSMYSMPVAALRARQIEWFCSEPEMMTEYYRRQALGSLPAIRRLKALGTDIVALGGDCASDKGPVVSPRHYGLFVTPQVRVQADACHALGMHCSTASDGNLWPMLKEFLLDTDVDGFEEIDYAAGMDLAMLKERCGARICFIGNLDIRRALTGGDEAAIRAHMRETIAKGWGSGGHVIMSSNSIHEGVPARNYLIALDEYRRHFGLTTLSS